jgi:hypothetical protein
MSITDGTTTSLTIEAVESQLRDHGATRICDFNQRERGSFCRGMCLDWIRRILNGKGVTYDYAMDSDKGRRAFARQVQTHGIFREVAKEKAALLGTGAKLENKLGWKKTFGNLMFWTPSTAELEAQMAPAVDLDDKIQQRGHVEPYWPDFSERWKKRVRSSSSDSDSEGAPSTASEKKRSMDTFQVLGNPFFQPSPSMGTADYLNRGITALRPDDCALIDVLFQEGAGHAWAWHCNNTGTYELFDPNYGIFAVGRPQDLLNCMCYFLDTVYPSFGKTVKSIEFVQMWR